MTTKDLNDYWTLRGAGIRLGITAQKTSRLVRLLNIPVTIIGKYKLIHTDQLPVLRRSIKQTRGRPRKKGVGVYATPQKRFAR